MASPSELELACGEAAVGDATVALLRGAEASTPTLFADLLTLFAGSRPALLRELQRLGVTLLRERQLLANTIGRMVRDGRAILPNLPRPPRVPSPPPLDEIERDAASRLRSVSAPAAADDALVPTGDGAGATTSELLDSISAEHFESTLQGAGVPPLHARVLLNARGVRGLRIGFWSNQLCERGTETALFDYADYAERLLGCVAFILYDGSSPKNVQASIQKFKARFGERVLGLGEQEGRREGAAGSAAGGSGGSAVAGGATCGDDGHGDGSSPAGVAAPARRLVWDGTNWKTRFAPHEIAPTLAHHRITHCYIIKFGHPDEPSTRWFGRCRTLVHAVFDGRTPHGDVYARIAPCVPASGRGRKGGVPVVPHIVRRRDEQGGDMREELGIPADATVFGRHGGFDVFDIFEAHGAVLSVARARPGIYFLFLNTRPLIMDENGEADVSRTPPNIIYLPATMDENAKQRFIRTCDAMLHARRSGETFGLAIAEVSGASAPC